MNQLAQRDISLSSQDDIVAEVERLAAGEVRTTGTHSFAKIIRHLAITNDVMTGKIIPPKLPWYARMMMPLLRSSILKGPAKAGFNLPSKAENFFWPDNEPDLQQSIAHLKESAESYKTNGPLLVHPIFGKATRAQLDSLAFSHAAMHLSFVHPT